MPRRCCRSCAHDQRAILALALPLIANSGIQLILNLTDVWFIGRISTDALAAVAAVHWLALVIVMVLGGIGMAVQTVAAQAYGACRAARTSLAVWMALWGLLLSVPLFAAAGLMGYAMLAPFGLPDSVRQLAFEFWLPRVAGSSFGAACWAVLGFFNGIGRPRISLLVTAVMAATNVLFKQWFIFDLGWGVAGSGFATSAAQACGLTVALMVFLSDAMRRRYRSHLTWRPLNPGSSFCLRSAGDATVPAITVLLLSWGLFALLAHALSFAPGNGWTTLLPQFGLGAIGGWSALVIYVLLLGCTLLWRWRSRAWMLKPAAA